MTKVAEMLNALGLPCSTGTVCNIIKKAEQASSLQVVNDMINDALKAQEVLHADELGLNVNGKLCRVHVVCMPDLTRYTLSHNRGAKGIQEGDILQHFSQTVVHDCWQAYWKDEFHFNHALCIAHLLRELKRLFKREEGDSCAKAVFDFLIELNNAKKKALASGAKSFDQQFLQAKSQQYDQLIQKGIESYPIPEADPHKKGRKSKGVARCLFDRLATYKDSILAFIYDFSIPFTNNQAERDVRQMRIKENTIGCFRTYEGALGYTRLLSFMSTARKLGVNIWKVLKACLTDTCDKVLPLPDY